MNPDEVAHQFFSGFVKGSELQIRGVLRIIHR